MVALTMVDESNAVSVVATRSALTGPTTLANPEPCVRDERSQATTSNSNAAPSNKAEVRRRVRAIRAPHKHPAAPPTKAAAAEPDGAMVATSTLHAKP
jgi:hypothetical protein